MYKTNENKPYYELEAQYKSNTDKIVVHLISLANEPLGIIINRLYDRKSTSGDPGRLNS